MTWSLAATLLLLSGDVELNPLVYDRTYQTEVLQDRTGPAKLHGPVPLLLSGDVEVNPGPKKGAPKEPAGPTPEQKISELETKVEEYQEKITGLETDLASQKEDSKQKLESLQTQMSQVTADLSKLKENDKNEELSTKLSQLGTDLDQKLTTAESKMALFMDTFEKFQSETSQTQASSKQQLDDVEIQINSFKSSSEGQVDSVMEDNENLKGNYSNLEQKVKDIKVEAQGKMQALLTATKEQRREYKSKFVDMDVEFSRMRERLETMNLILDDIQEKMYEFEQNKKNNIILHGVTTKHPETSESLRKRIVDIFRDNLNIRRDVPVTRASRIHTGPDVRGCRPVLVTFETFKDRETVLRLAKVLKKANVIVTEDLSKRTRENRQELRKFLRQIKRVNPEKSCYLEYDKLYVDSKIFIWNDALGQVIEQAEAERYGYDNHFMSRPGTQMMNMSRPGSQMSQMGHHPKSASSIPRLPPLSRAVSLATGMSQMSDPREEKLNELERVIASYQEKLDAVTTNYQEKVSILERKLVDKDMTNGIGGAIELSDLEHMDGSQSPGSIHVTFGKTNCFLIEDEQDPGTWIEEELEAKKADFIDEILNGNLQNGKSNVSDGEVDRDDDGFSPQPTNVHFNGSDGGYLEIPPEGMSAPPPTNKMSLPVWDQNSRNVRTPCNSPERSPQKKMIQPIIEEESNAQEGEVESNNSAER